MRTCPLELRPERPYLVEYLGAAEKLPLPEDGRLGKVAFSWHGYVSEFVAVSLTTARFDFCAWWVPAGVLRASAVSRGPNRPRQDHTENS